MKFGDKITLQGREIRYIGEDKSGHKIGWDENKKVILTLYTQEEAEELDRKINKKKGWFRSVLSQ